MDKFFKSRIGDYLTYAAHRKREDTGINARPLWDRYRGADRARKQANPSLFPQQLQESIDIFVCDMKHLERAINAAFYTLKLCA